MAIPSASLTDGLLMAHEIKNAGGNLPLRWLSLFILPMYILYLYVINLLGAPPAYYEAKDAHSGPGGGHGFWPLGASLSAFCFNLCVMV